MHRNFVCICSRLQKQASLKLKLNSALFRIERRCLYQSRYVRAEAATLAEKVTPIEAEEEKLTEPIADGETRTFSSKITKLVDEIANLSLLEVSDLNEALKKRLNLPDTPMMPAGMAMMAPAVAPAADQDAESEEDAPKAKKYSFTVKLTKFDDTKKIPLIKEIKNLVPGLNLVQAKKFVESLPQIVKEDIGQADADKMKETLTAVGGTVEIV